MGNKNTSALDGSATAPANYAGVAAPVDASFQPDLSVSKSVNSNSLRGSTTTASPDANAVLRLSAVIVLSAVVLLWLLGGIVFKNANI